MSHRRAVVTMVLATLMWSIAGVVTRQLEQARSFEVTFWRSAITVLALLVLLSALRGPGLLVRALRDGGRPLWLSAACWSVMFTAFMVALTLTTVANVLITMALAPLFTALGARLVLRHRLALRTWAAIVAAGCGIVWMYGNAVGGAGAQHVLGVAVALCVPVASAVNWTLMQHLHHGGSEAGDMLPALLLGALLSALLALPWAWPLSATAHDIGLLAVLGVVQLAIPCMLAMTVARVLPAPEIALLALLEVVFGVAWAWLGAGERPSGAVLGGGALVLAALTINEAQSLRARRAA